METSPASGDVTRWLLQWSQGSREALEKLLPLVYDELRRLAASYLRREAPGHTLQPTALVHEAFLRLVDQRSVEWKSRAQFFAIAARSMRQVLVDHARTADASKRGGSVIRITIDERHGVVSPREIDLEVLDEALKRLTALDPDLGRLVELRFFGGLTVEETAEVMGSSPRTIKREWRSAKAWLYREISGGGTG